MDKTHAVNKHKFNCQELKVSAYSFRTKDHFLSLTRAIKAPSYNLWFISGNSFHWTLVILHRKLLKSWAPGCLNPGIRILPLHSPFPNTSLHSLQARKQQDTDLSPRTITIQVTPGKSALKTSLLLKEILAFYLEMTHITDLPAALTVLYSSEFRSTTPEPNPHSTWPCVLSFLLDLS